MNQDLRQRVILPLLIPLAAIVIVEVIVVSMAQVLLTAGKNGAVVVALAVAIAIMVGAAAVAARPRLRTSSIIALLVLAGLASVAAGVWAYERGPAEVEHKEGHEAAAAPAAAVSAKDLVFSTKEIELPADKKVTMHFHNAEVKGITHNVAIYKSADNINEALFRGAIIDGGAEEEYEIGPLAAGSYYFQCDVHPTMNGTAKVA